MYLRDLVDSESEWAKYTEILAYLADFLEDCVKHLLRTHAVVDQAASKDVKYYHATIISLVRHVCEFVDGVAVLARSGCAEPCKPVLRSAFEATLGVYYILEADSEKRALAYQVAHAHARIKRYRKMKEDEQSGKEFRKLISSDPILGHIRLPKKDWQSGINEMQQLLARPEYTPIEKEWQAKKKVKDREPHWYELFGGPSSVRELALLLKQVWWYEFLYRQWSTAVHAGGCLENIAADKEGTQVVRPIRHPDGLQHMVSLAASLCIKLSRLLIDRYAPDRNQEFLQSYMKNLRQRYLRISNKKPLINMPWK